MLSRENNHDTDTLFIVILKESGHMVCNVNRVHTRFEKSWKSLEITQGVFKDLESLRKSNFVTWAMKKLWNFFVSFSGYLTFNV